MGGRSNKASYAQLYIIDPEHEFQLGPIYIALLDLTNDADRNR